VTRIAYQDFRFGEDRLALIETADAIAEEYRRAGYTLTLRQLYYQFVARGLIPNTERSYKNLGNAVNDGRLAGIISWEAIEDRGRGINEWLIEEEEREVLNGIDQRFGLDFWERQNAYVEVWVEKDALSSVIERPCRRWRVPYMPCKGYLSASEAWRAGRRFMRMASQGRRCVMIHLGDHDPSGMDMTRDNASRLELFGEAPVEVRRIALNMDQVEQYRPPENPAKLSDSRAADYVLQFGDKSWELDALEPRVLDALISDEIETLVDQYVWDETAAEERDRREILASIYERFDDVSTFLREQE
jgi:hypothetical protein